MEITVRLHSTVMFRAARLSSSLTTGPSSLTPALSTTRSYAISIQSPRVWPGKPDQRVFDERKTYLYHQFTSLLNCASTQPILFVHHKNFKANGMSKLRKDIVAAALPKGTQFSLLDTPPGPDTLPQVAVIRSSIFGVALRNHAPLDAEATAEIAKMAGGGSLAAITLPSLDPPILRAILRALERAAPQKSDSKVDNATKKAGDDEGRIPGRKMKRQKPILDPELSVVGALLEGRVFSAEKVKDVSKLPTLEILRQQVVGLISSPAVQLALVLGEASGGRLARTLEGLKKGLEEEDTTKNAESAP